MVPENATQLPTIKAVIRMICFFNLSTLIPKCCASFSPNIIAFNALPFGSKTVYEITRTIPKMIFFVHVAAAKLPKFQNVKSLNWSSFEM